MSPIGLRYVGKHSRQFNCTECMALCLTSLFIEMSPVLEAIKVFMSERPSSSHHSTSTFCHPSVWIAPSSDSIRCDSGAIYSPSYNEGVFSCSQRLRYMIRYRDPVTCFSIGRNDLNLWGHLTRYKVFPADYKFIANIHIEINSM